MEEKRPQPRNGATLKFCVGRVVATQGAIAQLTQGDILKALSRHHSGDWGDLCKEDWNANECALKTEGRLVSVYYSADKVKFYIITEWDRSLTTVLLPEEY